tara:strand:+ start:384 stop:581 length:198 start_codon:yes stop_codon:yes gene_type:complete
MAKRKEEKSIDGIAMRCELVGLKNLKITSNWRIELDTYEVEQENVKDLIDLIGKPVSIGIIPIEE